MALESERIQILKLVESKQVTPDEGARLLAALAAERRVPEPLRWRSERPATDGRCLRLQVQEPGRQNVNLALPLAAIPAILRVTRRWVPAEYHDVLDTALAAVNADFRGELLRVEEPGGQHIHIWIE
ncbi:MAG: SHOCT-like domain-containing protein [Chloroflexota bacterium]